MIFEIQEHRLIAIRILNCSFGSLSHFKMKTLMILASALFVAQDGYSQQDVSFLDSLGSSFGIAGDTAFDYVIVGAGTSGSTIAARLAEDPDVTVAVVEAGGFYQIENGNRSVVPGYSVFNFDIFSAPVTDWGILSTPQSQLNNRQVQYSRGQALGGSSAINFLIFHRYDRPEQICHGY